MIGIILFPLVRNHLFPSGWPSAEELAEEVRKFEKSLEPEAGVASLQ